MKRLVIKVYWEIEKLDETIRDIANSALDGALRTLGTSNAPYEIHELDINKVTVLIKLPE